jgi:polyisoprenoid-binding protein YceI
MGGAASPQQRRKAMLMRTGMLAAALAAGLAVVMLTAPRAESVEMRAAGSYNVDPVHSSVIFRIKHMNAAWFYGRFDELKGTLSYDKAELAASSLNLEIKIDSVHSGNARRDGHLKSPDFFNARQFPTATFVSTAFSRASDDMYEVTGDLTINGVTRPVTVQLERTGKAQGQQGELIGFHTTFDLKRSDYGISFMPEGLGDEVRMIVSIEAVAQ